MIFSWNFSYEWWKRLMLFFIFFIGWLNFLNKNCLIISLQLNSCYSLTCCTKCWLYTSSCTMHSIWDTFSGYSHEAKIQSALYPFLTSIGPLLWLIRMEYDISDFVIISWKLMLHVLYKCTEVCIKQLLI